jgi:hypothetical protein
VGDMKGTLFGGGRKSMILLEVSQASPALPPDKGSVKVKMLAVP